jgi:phage terminase large subunit-like protein
MRADLEQLYARCREPGFLLKPENKALASTMYERAREQFYIWEPYYNRSNGAPSWQWQFILAANAYKGRIALGGNRIGKSVLGAYECVLAITGKHPVRKFPESGEGWIVGLDNAMIRDIDRPLFEQFLPSRYKTKFYKQDNIWLCHGDGREWKIGFKSTEMGPDKFQGAKIDFIWFDEEPKKTLIFNEACTRLIDTAGVWWMTATPVRGTAWLQALSKRHDVFRTFAGMRENPHIPIEEVEAFALTLPEDERDVRIEGLYVTFGGNPVFPGKIVRNLLQRVKETSIGIEGVLEYHA